MPSRRLQPDRAIEISLEGNATRHAHENTEPSAAVEHLRTIACGRTDLMAHAAGTMLRSYLGSPGTHHPSSVYAVGLLVMAGADPSAFVGHTLAVRRG